MTSRDAIDAVVIPTGLSAPIWVQETTTWLGWLAAVLAVLIGFFRLAILVRDWRNGKQAK